MFSNSGILIVGQVQEFHNLILICKVTIIGHTIEFVVEFWLGFECSTIDWL